MCVFVWWLEGIPEFLIGHVMLVIGEGEFILSVMDGSSTVDWV